MTMTPASALAFFASVIKSGEPWTPACQQAMDEAMTHLTQPAQSVDVEKVREVIADIEGSVLSDEFTAPNRWADKLTAALQEKGNG